MRVTMIVAAALILASSVLAMAQGYYGAFPYYRASTAGESHARGFADVVRSAGETNLRNSEAAINYQEARSRHLDNRLKGTQTYFEMRRINKSYRDEQRKPRRSTEQLFRIAQGDKPARLTPAELDPVTGTIQWPIVLEDQRYQKYAEELQRQFAERAQTSGVIGFEAYEKIQQTINEALAALKSNVGRYKPNDYLAAKRLLESLAYEARFPLS
jgi:hypothetical protein